jgi:hypothetical protein
MRSSRERGGAVQGVVDAPKVMEGEVRRRMRAQGRSDE